MSKMRLHIVLVAVALTAVGCGNAVEKTVEEAIERQLEEEGGGDVNIDLDEDDGLVTIETDEGSVQIGGGQIPDDFPLPLPDYEEVAGVINQTDGGNTYDQVILSFNPDDFDEVASLYEDFFNDQGWDVSRTDSNSDGTRFTIISGTSEDVDAGVVVGYGEDDDAATLTLSYGTSG